MSTLTTGKRTRLQAEYQAQVAAWAKRCGVPAPTVRVRQRRGGRYGYLSRVIYVGPDCHLSTLVHEFAHHLSTARGHGPAFRIALVEAATVAYGMASRYPWSEEYDNVKRWAHRHGLVASTS